MTTRAGHAMRVERFLTGSGVAGVRRANGTAALYLPGWAGKAYGPRGLPDRATPAMVLRDIDTETSRSLSPFLVRVVDDEIEQALAIVRLEDWARQLRAREQT